METNEVVNLLYKKIQGAPYTNQTIGALQEAQGTSSPMIPSSRIWSQAIPSAAPNCPTATTLTAEDGSYLATKNTNSGEYSYIQGAALDKDRFVAKHYILVY